MDKAGKAKDEDKKQGDGSGSGKRQGGDGPKKKETAMAPPAPSMAFEKLAFRSIYATVDVLDTEEVAEFIPEPNMGIDSKGIGFSSVGHYLRNLRRLHRKAPLQPLAVVVPGSTITIAKVIAKV